MLREAREKNIIPSADNPVKKRPNVLVIDIETSLMSFHAWRCGKQYLGPDQIIEDWHMLSWAAKWLMEPDVFSDVLTTKEAKAHDDERISKSIWEFIDKADIVIAHNARGFDIPKLNTRFIVHGMKPPSPYKVIDTLLVFRYQAKFSSNKQDELCKKLGLARKVEHEGYSLWIKCFHGDEPSLRKMLEYNEGDIMGLEEMYVYIRPWIKSHPNMNLFIDGGGDCCPNCGSAEVKWLDKMYSTSVNQYSCYRCNGCGAVGRSRVGALAKKDKVSITSIAQ